jgi:hypothetical protein
MNTRNAIAVATIFVAGAVGMSGCASDPALAIPEAPAPVVLTSVKGTTLKQVTLSEPAMARLGLRTASVRAIAGGVTGRTTVPYAALIYDEDGATWTFVETGLRTFVRSAVVVASIDADTALLSRGPAVGTTVVTTGAEELLGAEYEVSGE